MREQIDREGDDEEDEPEDNCARSPLDERGRRRNEPRLHHEMSSSEARRGQCGSGPGVPRPQERDECHDDVEREEMLWPRAAGPPDGPNRQIKAKARTSEQANARCLVERACDYALRRRFRPGRTIGRWDRSITPRFYLDFDP